MLKVLRPRRLEVLEALHQTGAVSVRQLAGRMKRDYKNLHHDLQVLERVGLVARSADGKLAAPPKKIVSEIALAA
jgi:predicted transcriptional regulator